ncbi:uncharacterized protein LOC136089419 isoform X2 [Hydra vulgaris]|uniref:Uncharacterized protein LOC136089419 isoform X2 n=1 Tax=Hydra vulgaris TaxID=6087 RepID=A0ABM4DAW2_HYDVU
MKKNKNFKSGVMLFLLLYIKSSKAQMFVGNKEMVITKGKLLGTLTIPKEYEVYFEVYLNSTLNTYTNVIHITNGVNCCKYGSRISTVYFTSNLVAEIDAPVNNDGNYHTYTKPFTLQKWTRVKIKQYLSAGNYIYTVEIDGDTVNLVKNTNPQVFQNVKLFVSDLWYEAQPGYIRNLFVQNFMEDLKESVLETNNLIATLPSLQKSYSVSFKIKPKSYKTMVYSSVIHLTIGGNKGNDGDRTPGVWFSNDGLGSLLIVSSVNGDVDYSYFTQPLQLNEWSSIRISQFQINEVYMYALYFNGSIIYSIKNAQPKEFSNVYVYAADPWYETIDATIKDFRILNGNEETCGLLTALSGRNQNEEVYIQINLTTNCVCYLQNVTIYLRPDTLLVFKGFLWDDLNLNESFVKKDGRIILFEVGKLSKDSFTSFSAVFVYGKIPNGRINASVEALSKWSYCYGDPVFKINQINFNVPIIKKPITSEIKMYPIWSQSQPNQTFLQNEMYQFVCTIIQPSPCYQREISTGIITFLPVQLLDVFGYDSSIKTIYGRTLGNNVVEINLNEKKPKIITKEKCIKINACQLFFS